MLGNVVITSPQKAANQYNFLAFLVSCVIATAVCICCFFVPFNKPISILLTVLAFYCLGESLVVFIEFIYLDLLPNTPPILIALPFVLMVIYFAFKSESVILKFALVSFVVCVAVIFLFFFATLKDFSLQNIFIKTLPDFYTLSEQISPYLKGFVLPVVLISFFAKLSNFKKSTALCGVWVGVLLLAVTILNSVLLFGVEFSARLDFPYSAAGSTVTFGNLFTRLDGFLYFVYLSSCLVKCAVSIAVIKKSRSLWTP